MSNTQPVVDHPPPPSPLVARLREKALRRAQNEPETPAQHSSSSDRRTSTYARHGNRLFQRDQASSLNPYAFNSQNAAGADAATVKAISQAGGAYCSTATFNDVKLKHDSSLLNLPAFVDVVTEILARHNVEALAADACDFPEFIKHAKLDCDRPVIWTQTQWSLIQQWWGAQLRKLCGSHASSIPRLNAITADERIPAAERTFATYFNLIITREGGSQSRLRCNVARAFLSDKAPLDLSKGWCGVADLLESKVLDIQAGNTTVPSSSRM